MTEKGAKAIFLDLDGTLADSMDVMRWVYVDFMAGHGIPVSGGGSKREFYKLAGRTSEDILAVIRERHGISDSLEEMAAAYHDLVDQRYQDYAKLMPGGRELLQAAARFGVFCCVVTSARTSVAQGFLERQGLSEYVQGIVSADDIRRGKPDPEPFALALKLSGQPAKLALAVEDAPNGAISATGAGIATWIMAPKGHDDFPRIPGVQGFITSLEQLIPYLDTSY